MFLFYLECFSDLSLPRVFGMVQDGDLRPFDFVWLLIVAVKHMFSHSRLLRTITWVLEVFFTRFNVMASNIGLSQRRRCCGSCSFLFVQSGAVKLVLCDEIGSLWSLDAPEFYASVTSENQFHCTRLYNALAWIVDKDDRTRQDVPADARKVLVRNVTTRQQVPGPLWHRSCGTADMGAG